jgi:integrase
MAKDTKTRYQGVYARHKTGCRAEGGGRCTCNPSYWGKVYDRDAAKNRHTAFLPTLAAARNAREDLRRDLRSGMLPANESMRLASAAEAFLRSARDGLTPNKHGRRYKPSALRDLEGALLNHVIPALGVKRVGDVRRRDVQRLVDELAPTRSGSRVRTVVSAIHSLYRWAQARELVYHDPAALVQLPAMQSQPRDRVASVDEMQRLLEALDLEDALPYAIAVYATARRDEVRHLRLEDIDLKLSVVYLGTDEGGRKSRAAQRAVPIVRPLGSMLRRSLMMRGRPLAEELVCPGHKPGGRNSGMLSFEALQTRADRRWREAALQRITAHECRHTCATWLDAAGVRPVVVSRLMGHALPARQAGAAQITQERYTHVLPDDLTLAKEQLEAFLTKSGDALAGLHR